MRIGIVQNVSINDHRMIHTNNIAQELSNRGHEVEIIIQKSDSKIKEKSPYCTIEIPGGTYTILGQTGFCFNLLKQLKKRNYDIIHAKNPFTSVLPAILRRSKSKIIYDIRGLWIDFGVRARYFPRQFAPLLNNIDVFCMNHVDVVIAISHELKKILVQRGVKENKVKVIIGDGVDIVMPRIYKDIRKHLGIDGNVIGYVGTIGRSRFSDRIIRAFSLINKKSNQNIYLVMIGPCSYGESDFFLKLIEKLHLEDLIFLTGLMPHDEVLQYISSFDVAIAYHETNLPIYTVAVPTKILEYLAAGCKIVTTNQKMYENLLTHGKDAYLTAQNPCAFAEGILYVLENEGVSKRLSKNAVITAEKYSIQNIVDEIEEIYYNL